MTDLHLRAHDIACGTLKERTEDIERLLRERDQARRWARRWKTACKYEWDNVGTPFDPRQYCQARRERRLGAPR